MDGQQNYKTNVRSQYLTKFEILNAGITYFMGKPLAGQRPYFIPSAKRSFWLCVSGLFIFPATIVFMLQFNFWIAVITSYFAAVFMTGLFRKFQVEFGHHASHQTFIRGSRSANQFYLNLSTFLAICQNAHEYKKEHSDHHNRKIFTTSDDADAALLLKFGFMPRLSKGTLWMNLGMTVFSPKFHLFLFCKRIKSNFHKDRSWFWTTFSLLWLGLLSSTLYFLPIWVALTTIILPLTLFYQISALCQFLTEHAWLKTKEAPNSQQEYADRCWGRFTGEPLPDKNLGKWAFLISWSGFLFRYLFIHFPSRYAILVGDLPAHDWHHLSGYMGVPGHNWPAGIYERQNAIEIDDKFSMSKREIWGIVEMFDHVFSILESSPDDMLIKEGVGNGIS